VQSLKVPSTGYEKWKEMQLNFDDNEMLGPILLTHHNLTYYQRLMRDARLAIEENRYGVWMQEKIAGWQKEKEPSP
jgi:tRNA-guanine family transglycosylase